MRYKDLVSTKPFRISSVQAAIHLANQGSTEGGVRFGKHSSREMMIYWHEPCVDTTHYSLDVLIDLLRINPELPVVNFVNERKKKILSFVKDHIDDNSGGFRHHQKYWPSLYGTSAAMSAMSRLGNPELVEGEAVDDLIVEFGPNSIKKIGEFIKSCEHPLGGFASTPEHSHAPTILDTDAAVYMADQLLPVTYRQVWNRESSHQFVWSRYRDVLVGGGAFSNIVDETEPHTYPTFHALRAVRQINRLDEGNKDRLIRIVEFLEKCRTPEGGYGSDPGSRSSVVFTECALNAKAFIANVLNERFLDERWNDISDDLRSVFSYGGFSYDDVTPPNIHATRSAVRVLIKILESPVGSPLVHKRMSREIFDYVVSLYDGETGGFRGHHRVHEG